jgi:hypothetical protein
MVGLNYNMISGKGKTAENPINNKLTDTTRDDVKKGKCNLGIWSNWKENRKKARWEMHGRIS